jgi:hypothetical protein
MEVPFFPEKEGSVAGNLEFLLFWEMGFPVRNISLSRIISQEFSALCRKF